LASDVQSFVAYPLRIVNGTVVTSRSPQHVREMIEQVLFTMPGERVMYPEFGVGLERLIFGSTASDIMAATQALISEALQEWLGDVIVVLGVAVAAAGSKVSISVVYELLATHETRHVVFER
jgi:phage baseplate assembly protein W